MAGQTKLLFGSIRPQTSLHSIQNNFLTQSFGSGVDIQARLELPIVKRFRFIAISEIYSGQHRRDLFELIESEVKALTSPTDQLISQVEVEH